MLQSTFGLEPANSDAMELRRMYSRPPLGLGANHAGKGGSSRSRLERGTARAEYGRGAASPPVVVRLVGVWRPHA